MSRLDPQEQLRREVEGLEKAGWLEVMRAQLSTPVGRDFLYRVIFDVCGLTSAPQTTNGSEALVLNAQHNIGARLLHKAQIADPLLAITMQEEQIHKARARYEGGQSEGGVTMRPETKR